jgi:hypothetical protein
MERVLFCPIRNANPFFHLMESLWMLGGRNDLPWLAYYNKRMSEYSDDGGLTQPAAYGHRWRVYFGYDQLEYVLRELTQRPNSRRAVLAMWDAAGLPRLSGDLGNALNGSKDVPCNTHAYFQLKTDGTGTHLDMTVCCRSNDAIWGAHGANAVHFSVLLEWMTAMLASRMKHPINVGTMTQFSNNYHVYKEVVKHDLLDYADSAAWHDHYQDLDSPALATPMFTDVKSFNAELPKFLEWASPKTIDGQRPGSFATPFLDAVAKPMVEAWDWHKRAAYDRAIGSTFDIAGTDWQLACREWMTRRRDNNSKGAE